MTTGEGWNVAGLVNREPAKQNQNGSIGSILWENLTGSSGRRQTDVNDKTLLSSLPNRIHAATEEAGSGTTFHPVWSPLPLITVLGPSVVQNHHGGLDIFMKKCCIFCSRITSAAAAKHSVNRKNVLLLHKRCLPNCSEELPASRRVGGGKNSGASLRLYQLIGRS